MEEVNFRGVHNGHEQTYNWVRQFLCKCDFPEVAHRLGFIYEDDPCCLKINFLGRVYRITKDSVELDSEQIEWKCNSDVLEFNIKSILAYYAISQGGGEPLNQFARLGSYSHGVFSSGSSLESKNGPLQKLYGKDYGKFEKVAKLLGAILEKNNEPGKYLWHYDLLPRVPVKLAYYEGDDEIPTSIQVLFDSTALNYFKFEPLAVLNMCLMQAIIKIPEQKL
ncbi:MAG: hypothetical protein Ta2F_01010 [Termitinemataceae bacterium]|nr:MAG: hypothetical protein Ta2F_01010 [Termitinemataceae bacterium]